MELWPTEQDNSASFNPGREKIVAPISTVQRKTEWIVSIDSLIKNSAVNHVCWVEAGPPCLWRAGLRRR